LNQKYPTKEKLKQKKEIDLLFSKGKWLTFDNLRVISLDLKKNPQEDFLLLNQKVGVSVSKKFFKKAVDRNRIKRLLRVAYRVNKDLFVERFGAESISMVFWISKDKPKSLELLEKNFAALCKTKK
jgi:ribonuclease P protein component